MTEAQYRQVLANRARRSVALFAGGAADRFLRAAAREAKRRSVAYDAWRSIVSVEWADQAAVASMREGTLVVEAASAPLREQIRRQTGTLLRQLKARVPGLVALRIVSPAVPEEPREEVD